MSASAVASPAAPTLLERLRDRPSAQDALDAACALELARELFVMAATTREQTAESAACAKYGLDAPQTKRAGDRVQKKRTEARAHFDRHVGLDK